MSEKFKTTSKELEELIAKAVKKIDAQKENDICRYIPVSSGGYIHHFTMRKMKTENPEQLRSMIKEHILDVNTPQTVTPKPRAPRGSRKRRDQFLFTKQDIDRLLELARHAGDLEMINRLTVPQDPRAIQKKLIYSIRHGKAEQELWAAWTQVVNNKNNQEAALAPSAAPAFPV